MKQNKMLKSEKLIFEDKNFLIFVSFPMKYANNKALDRIRKKIQRYTDGICLF